MATRAQPAAERREHQHLRLDRRGDERRVVGVGITVEGGCQDDELMAVVGRDVGDSEVGIERRLDRLLVGVEAFAQG